MRKLKCFSIFLFAMTLCVAFISCEEENGVEDFTPKEYNVSGRVEKGPFVSGSAITIQPMSEQMQVLGAMYSSTIQDHTGNFSFGSRLFESPYAELTANGYFFNEVTGQLSSGTLYLRAIVDLTKSETVNVNILTHIKYQRVLNLISQGKTYAEANRQAQEELFTAFGLQRYANKDASLYSIIEGTDESAALIAISSLILVERSEAEITEYLARLCKEFADNGTFSDNTKEQIKSDRKELQVHDKLSSISSNIQTRYNDLGIEVEVKELMHFYDWDDDGIAGNEFLGEGESISLEIDTLEVPYSGGTYTIKIQAPIPVYLETPWLDLVPPSVIVPDEVFGADLYQFSTSVDDDIVIEKSIKDNVLTINVSELNSYRSKSAHIQLYDGMGTTLGTITVEQNANPNIAPPQCIGLGPSGSAIFGAIATDLADAFSYFNQVEQIYHYNHLISSVDNYIVSASYDIAGMWKSFYTTNTKLEQMRHFDEQNLNIFGEVFDVFSAMMYYNMIVAWGDVPYVVNYEELTSGIFEPSRTNQDIIFDDLIQKLISAINILEEKKNEPLTNINSLFFTSKDVARVLLANIYMYRKQYSEAQLLLKDVVDAGFYSLDNSNYSTRETIDRLLSEHTGSELILGFIRSIPEPRTTRSTVIEFRKPPLIPIMTYTDVVLSYAECLYHEGETSIAEKYLHQVVEAKSLEVGDELFEAIKNARKQLFLYGIGNFAFYKRNDIAMEELAIKQHQLLLPIPRDELYYNPNMTPNPGYESESGGSLSFPGDWNVDIEIGIE